MLVTRKIHDNLLALRKFFAAFINIGACFMFYGHIHRQGHRHEQGKENRLGHEQGTRTGAGKQTIKGGKMTKMHKPKKWPHYQCHSVFFIGFGISGNIFSLY
jgi:hypothetical protein